MVIFNTPADPLKADLNKSSASSLSMVLRGSVTWSVVDMMRIMWSMI